MSDTILKWCGFAAVLLRKRICDGCRSHSLCSFYYVPGCAFACEGVLASMCRWVCMVCFKFNRKILNSGESAIISRWGKQKSSSIWGLRTPELHLLILWLSSCVVTAYGKIKMNILGNAHGKLNKHPMAQPAWKCLFTPTFTAGDFDQ